MDYYGWTVRRLNPSGARIYAPVKNGAAAHSTSYTPGGVSLSREYSGRGMTLINSIAEVEERVELYLYSSAWPSRSVLDRTLPFTLVPPPPPSVGATGSVVVKASRY
jgi:hypothetical protein